MGLGGKNENLAKQLQDSQAQVKGLQEDLGRARQEAEESDDRAAKLEQRVADLETKVTDHGDRLAALEDRVTKLEGRADTSEEESKAFRATLANPSKAMQEAAGGRPAPVAEGGEGAAGGGGMTWEQARKECGSYAAARKKYPDAFAREFPEIAAKAAAQEKAGE